MKELVKILLQLNYTISCCESITGGGFGQKISSISGASKVFKGGFITYNDMIKNKIVGVDYKIIKKYGAISQECAIEMAKNTQKLFDTNIAVSFTGNAGPIPIENKNIGLVYVAIVINNKIWCQTWNFIGNRHQIRSKVISQTILVLKNKLLE